MKLRNATLAAALVLSPVHAKDQPLFLTPFRVSIGLAGSYVTQNTAEFGNSTLQAKDQMGDPTSLAKSYEISPTIEAGYQFQNGLYTGVMMAYHHAPVAANTYSNVLFGGDITTYEKNLKRLYSFSVLGKIGYHMTPKFDWPLRPYVVLGPSFTKWNSVVSTYKNSVFKSKSETDYSATGLALGLGVDYFITDHFVMSLSYTHTHFKKGEKISVTELLGMKQGHNTVSLKVSYVF